MLVFLKSSFALLDLMTIVSFGNCLLFSVLICFGLNSLSFCSLLLVFVIGSCASTGFDPLAWMIGSRESWIFCPSKLCRNLKYQLRRIHLILLQSSLRSLVSFGNYRKTLLFAHLFPWQWIFQEYDSITRSEEVV